MSALPETIRAALADRLGASVRSVRAVGGGCIGHAVRVELADGRTAFIKRYEGDPAMVQAEAHGLGWLHAAAAIRVPGVLAVGDAHAPYLALEWIEQGGPSADFDDRFGRSLAALHAFGAPSFGLERDNFIGSLPQTNAAAPDWPTFLRTRRLEPMVEQADAWLDASLRSAFDRLYARIDDLCGPTEPPSRLHGDLWSGNLLVAADDGAPVLVDPAVYGGHREVDLAMMKLFGGFSPRVFEAYDEALPLAPDWRDRIPLNQIYPLLVHVALFGGAYVGQLSRALHRYV